MRSKIGLLTLFLVFHLGVSAQEICNNGIDDDLDGFVDCYDADCNGSADCAGSFFGQTASCQYMPGPGNFGMRPKWNTDSLVYDIFSTVTPVSGDWDNDGVAEVFAYSHNGLTGGSAGPGNKIYVINGIYGTVEDSIVMPINAARFQTSGMALGDLDNDGFGEIVVMGEDSRLRCYEHTTAIKWTSPQLSVPLTPVVNIADFDQDGNAEVYVSAFVFNGQTGAQIGVGAFPPSGAVGAPIVSGGLVGLGMSVAADVLPTGFCADCAGLELVAGNKVFSVNVATNTITVQTTANAPGGDGFTALADYDKDGDLDGIISTDAAGPGQTFVYVWDLQTATVVAQSAVFNSATFWTIGQCNVGDFDGDGLLEVGVVTEDVYRVLDDHTTGLALLWSKTTVDESGFTGSVLFDFQGDGVVEVVYQDEDSIYVYEGNTGATLASVVCRGGTVANHPIVLDVDGDDQAEIVCGCSEGIGVDPRLHGYIQAFGPVGNSWVNAREVWNQHSYWITNVNDDLSIPRQQQNHHIIGDSVIINGFNIQSTELTSSGQPTYAASDAIVNILSVDLANCGVSPNTIDVMFEVINQSPAAVFPRGAPVALYNGDPTLPGAVFIDSVHITNSLPNGGTEVFTLTIPDQGGTFDLWIVANDTGHSVTPVTFPNAGIGECDFTNNFDSTAINCSPDHDLDGIPNITDIDDDNDGIPDLTELGGLDPNADVNTNGIEDWMDPAAPGFVDTNSDGIDDRYDSDFDGVPNHYDIDADNDGLADAVEGNGGTIPPGFDNASGTFTGPVGANGMPDNSETAVDNGVTILALTNSDGDPIPDYLDIDADNDGIVDNIEVQTSLGYVAPGGVDANGDGRDDIYDGAGALTPTNTDAVGAPDYLDLDSDDDGVPDPIEGHDANMDGIADTNPAGTDADGDGLDDNYDTVVLGGPGVNATGSNAPLQNTDGADDRDWRDTDDDNDGIPTALEDFNLNNDWSDDFTQGGGSTPDYLHNPDHDLDGVSDVNDIDDDNDGIPDLTELGGLSPDADVNLNGIVDWNDPAAPGFVDVNGDNVDDRYDSDLDGVPNHWDIDADNDGLADGIEGNGGTAPAGFDNATGTFTGAVGLNGMPDNAETVPDNGITVLPLTNSDADPLADYLDIDADNDGIVDNIEVQTSLGYLAPSGLDANGDGRDDAYDGAGALTPTNTDAGGAPDYLDLDSDDDGVPDPIEGHDANMDGIADTNPAGTDADGDGLDDNYDNVVLGGPGVNATGSNAPLQNTDGADDRDWRDTDDDNDGLLTVNEDFNTNNDWSDDFTQGGPSPDYLQSPDHDMDGIPDVTDIDDDNDGIPDLTELGGLDPNADGNSNGIPDWRDPSAPGFVDVNSDGVDDRYDSDFDGVPNHYDIDADNDGLADAVEGNGGVVPPGFDNASGTFTGPVGANGMPDNSETAVDNGVTILALTNSDADPIPDYLDIDADNDGIVDNIEVQTSLGYVAPSGVDANGDGRDDIYDGAGALTPTNTDAVGAPDYLDLDSDEDGVQDFIEGHDANMDGIPDNVFSGVDTDGDGLDDAYDIVVLGGAGVNATGSNAPLQNTDGLDDRDWRDTDDDNDGILTINEDFNTNNNWADDFTQGGPSPDYLQILDVDQDGITDLIDIDDDNDGIPDLTELGGLDPNSDVNSNGVPDWLDPFTPGFVDTNFDGVDDRYDTDFDGVPNHLDIDADDDGLADGIEGNGGLIPANFDNATGRFTGPVGTNGMPDNAETAVDNGVTILALSNSDGDPIPDYLDIDADNDGIVDNIEVQTSLGYVAPSGTDANLNGRDDIYDGAGALTPTNTDAAGAPDYLDLDSDDDGVPDPIEGHDANMDGIADISPAGTDADGDGLDDNYDTVVLGGPGVNATGSNAPLQNTDGADDRDWRDTDDDNDGTLTINEDYNTNNDWSDDFTQGGPSPDYLQVPDVDGDGIPNVTDIDDDNDGIPDLTELGGLNPDADVNTNGIADFQDPSAPGFVDTNSDGIDDRYDNDLDGVPNHYDIDADNDGLADGIEGNGGTAPAGFDNATGRFTGPVGANGMPDNSETAVDNGVTILPLPNSDADAVADYLDIDADNDGIVDNIEVQTTLGYVPLSGTDADGNGRDDAYDGAGALTPTNTDAAGAPDYLDLDSDEDGVPDLIEGHDANMDGVADNTPSGLDSDGDGLDDAFDTLPVSALGNPTGSNAPLQNTDGADDRDWRDTDDDNDGLLTINEDFNTNNDWSDDFTQGGPNPDYLQVPDVDGDGIPNVTDIDDDNDGIPDFTELGGLNPDADVNSNGIADFQDPAAPGFVDINSDGIDDRYDSDLDGVPNHYDIDADNDGLADAIEANGGLSPAGFDNASGTFTGPVGANGMPDNSETAVDNGVTILPLTNSDGDPAPDYLDIDADNDGIVDNIEVQTTPGYAAPSGTDADGNGRDDAYDGAGALTPTNTDAGGTPDYLDLDSDDDGVPDLIEGHDANMDGIADTNPAGTDADGDGLDDNYDTVFLGAPGVNATGSNAPLQNTDGTDDRDWRDTDDDNDGLLTINEDFNTNNDWSDDFTQGGGGTPDYLYNPDHDNDGIQDVADIDDDNDGIPDITELGGLDPDADVNLNGIVDWLDPTAPGFLDTNSDGIDDRYDGDRDGVPNHWDIDADDEGVVDAIEANGGVVPANFDNTTGSFTGPVGVNGMPDNSETAVDNGVSILPMNNSDGDPLPDYLDIDSDNDGIVDNIEFQTTLGYVPPLGNDLDGNGRDDAYDGATALVPVDTETDGTPDYRDQDSENDGVPDFIEGHDANWDGFPDNVFSGSDADNDGLDDAYDNVVLGGPGVNATGSNAPLQNTDGLDDRDWRDTDDDNDGIPTGNGSPGSGEDFNANGDWADDFTQGGTGIPDYLFNFNLFPVTLTSLDAELQGKDGLVKWVTAAEVNSDYFRVFRSTDGINFTQLGTVQAAGTTTQEQRYEFLDRNITNLGVPTVWYKLEQVDLNGAHESYGPVALTITYGDPSVTVYPNPAYGQATLDLRYLNKGGADVYCVNTLGQQVFHLHVDIDSPIVRAPLDLDDISAGVYTIVVVTKFGRHTTKLRVGR